jgi:hypothetical protein
MKHKLDDNMPIYGDGGDITNPDERYAFFENLSSELLNVLRIERNKKLVETDYWAYQDTPDMTAEQTAYRQALRDITETYTSLEDVVWPTKPSS